MINILYFEEKVGFGGIEQMMLQWVKHAGRDIHIDLLTSQVVDERTRQSFLELGCEVHEAHCSVKNLLRKSQLLVRLLKKKKYSIIHIHTSLATDFVLLAVAKHCGVKHRIAHSHNVPVISRVVTRWADYLCKPLLRYYTTDYFGCSRQAAIALFGKSKKYLDRYVVVKNGVDIDRFRFSMESRNEIRQEFGIGNDQFVIGSVGRIDYQKNYMCLLETVAKLRIDKSKYRVMLVGDGKEKAALQQFAVDHEIDLILPGKRSDINRIMSCFDLFVLTSRFEGFPVVMVEAQASGVACLVSDVVPEEAVFMNTNTRLSIENTDEWVSCLQDRITRYDWILSDRVDGYNQVKENGYSIEDSSKQLMYYYRNMCC